MGAKKRLQKLLDKANKGTGNTTEATDNRDEIQEALVSSGKGNLVKRGKRLYERMNKGSGIKMVSPLNDSLKIANTYAKIRNHKSEQEIADDKRREEFEKYEEDKGYHLAAKNAKKKKAKEGKKAVKDLKKVTDQGNKTKGITMISPLSAEVRDHTNTSCWKSKVKVGTKMSNTNPGVRVNDCVDPSSPRAKNK